MHDSDGRIAGFTARANPAEETQRPDTPKYLNTAATAAYDKGRLLLGLDDVARARLAAGATPVLCEGPFDVAALRTVPDVVPLAACGTAVTADHLEQIAAARGGTLAGLVAAFDDDDAGRAAATRLWDLVGAHEAATLRYASWDGAKDPGELVQTGRGDDLATAITTAAPLSVALVRHVLATTPHDGVAQQVILATGIAGQVLPSADIDTVLAAQTELAATLCDPDQGGHLDEATITAAFAEAVEPARAPSALPDLLGVARVEPITLSGPTRR